MKKLLLALLFACSSLAAGQVTILMPIPYIQFSDSSGNPLANGFVYTYQAGTSINQATYTDSTGTTINTDPISLNAGGEPSSPLGPGFAGGIYFINNLSYRICVYNFNSVQQWCADNVRLVSSAQVGGANGQVQFNCAGAFCGNAGFTFNVGTQTLSVVGLVVSAGGSLNGVFTGSPTFANLTVSGILTITNLQATNITDTCANPSSSGFIRMCNTDMVNWRNSTNSGDEGLQPGPMALGKDSLDINFLGGLLLPVAAPIRFGGLTAGFPELLPSGSGLVVELADGSGTANITANEANLNGVLLPTNTPSGAGLVLTTLSTTTAAWETPSASVLAQSTTTLSAPVSVAMNTATVWISKLVTMPASGCPCRVDASYDAYFMQGSAGADVAWVYDGTNQFATAQTANTGNTANYGIGSSAYSTTTYANSAIVTFTGFFFTNSSSGGTVLTNTVTTGGPGTPQNSWLNLVVIPSN